MADNVEANPGSGGAIFAADEIAGVIYPRSKLIHGADGTNDGDVSAANPLPVYLATVGNTQPVSAASLPLPTGAATESTLDAISSLLAGGIIVGGTVAISGGTVTVTGTFWQATQPISAASLPLPTGAATEATLSTLNGKVTACNTGAVVISSALPAGTNNIGDVDVLSVPADPFGANADSASASGSISAKLRFIASTGIPVTGTVTVGTHAVTQSGTWNVATVTNLSQLGGTAIAMNTGTRAAGVQRVTICTDDVVLCSQSGTWNVGTVTTVTTVSTVTAVTTVATVTSLSQFAGAAINLNTGNAGTGTLRVVLATDQPALTTPMPVAEKAGTAGGWTPYSFLAAAGANQDSTVVKASAGQVGWIVVTNTNAAVRYLKLYNLSSGATSASTPVLRFAVPGNTAGAGIAIPIPAGVAFGTGISFRLTTGVADNDANAVAANEVIVNLGYA